MPERGRKKRQIMERTGRTYYMLVLINKEVHIMFEDIVRDAKEKELSDTVSEALRQIGERDYQASLIAKGIPQECIRKYEFAFCGKKVLIGECEKNHENMMQ